MKHPFNQTKLRVDIDTNDVIHLLDVNGIHPEHKDFARDEAWMRNVYISEDEFITGFSSEQFDQSPYREITVADLIEGEVRKIPIIDNKREHMPKELQDRLEAPNEINLMSTEKKPRKKYVTKNTPLERGDWVELKATGDLAIVQTIGGFGSRGCRVTLINGDSKGLTLSLASHSIERFKGKITIKA